MMQECRKAFEERLKVKYLCPCAFLGLVMYTTLDERYEDAMRRADEWLSNGDSSSILGVSEILTKLADQPGYDELLARNAEQLERQRQIYFAGRDNTKTR